MAADFSMDVNEVATNLKRLSGKIPPRLARALFVVGQGVLQESKKIVPKKLETLKQSGTVDPPKMTSEGASLEISYGGPAAAYATAIHEHPSGSSPPSWGTKKLKFTTPGTGTKYLEKPLFKKAKTLDREVGALIDLDSLI
jgi:hypothetical protein